MTGKRTARAASQVLLAAVAFAALAGPARAAPIAVGEAWMRPATAGQPTADAYLDVRSELPARLVAARSSAASRVDLVAVAGEGDAASERVVASLPVRAGGVTRLAFRGPHLRLVGVARPLATGDLVPLELHFATDDGDEIRVDALIVVRGLTPRAQPGAEPSGGIAPR